VKGTSANRKTAAAKRRTLPLPTYRPATEQRNRRIAGLDALDTLSILRLINSEDATVPGIVASQLREIAKAVDAVVRSLARGGRLFYVGAGTSGRLAVLDAAECPPTFGIAPETVQALIAGGTRALLAAAEAAEDDSEQGRRDLADCNVNSRDVVIGLTASGRTPYTLGALAQAKSHRAITVAITSNPGSPITRVARIAIVPQTGPEVLAGSTRMKAALAQKMILHMISTAAMARLGHIYKNYMVGVRPTNQKLIDRAAGIVSTLAGVNTPTARQALRQAGNNVKVALVMLQAKLSRDAAAALLRRHSGNLRKIPAMSGSI
jgi:N-acetylmuramic acid 6-phosphate etherase